MSRSHRVVLRIPPRLETGHQSALFAGGSFFTAPASYKENRLTESHFPSWALPLLAFLLLTGAASAAQKASPYPQGMRYCPAPWCDNSDFLDTHFGMDAKTGKVYAYKGSVHPDEIANPPGGGEVVLYSAPPISVENKYVPPSQVAARAGVSPGGQSALAKAPGGKQRRNNAEQNWRAAY